ncbi:integrase catalytic domain-containing protein [Trichonephila clavipes]|nr:integrase catalytic domain-containing protein [Trichonephila clavipes]
MWFSGPDLQTDEYEDNHLFPDPSHRDELKCAVTLSTTECSSNFYDELFNVTNNFIKLIRNFSFIFRFINNIKAKESCNKDKYLTADETKKSTEFFAEIAQLSEFKAEIYALKKGKGVSKTSKLKALDPFLDENSLLRVGGRLSNADLSFEAKHQIIIPTLSLTDSVLLAFVKNDNAILTHGSFGTRRYSVDIFDLPLVLITIVLASLQFHCPQSVNMISTFGNDFNPPTGQHGFFRPTREALKTDHTEFFLRPGTHQK